MIQLDGWLSCNLASAVWNAQISQEFRPWAWIPAPKTCVLFCGGFDKFLIQNFVQSSLHCRQYRQIFIPAGKIIRKQWKFSLYSEMNLVIWFFCWNANAFMWYQNCVMRLNHSIRFESICFGVLNNFPLCRDCVCELSREQNHHRARRKGRFQSVATRRVCCASERCVCDAANGFIIIMCISCDSFEESERARAVAD